MSRSLLFAEPLALWALLSLPLFYLLIKQLPPKPLVHFFAPIKLLNPSNKEVENKKPPLLLLLIRLSLIASIILFFAKPYVAEENQAVGQNIHILIPNDWATAFALPEIKQEAKNLIKKAELNKQTIYLSIGDKKEQLSADEALKRINSFTPENKQPSTLKHSGDGFILSHGLHNIEAERAQIYAPEKAYAAILKAEVKDKIYVTLYNPEKAKLSVSLKNLNGQTLSQSNTESNTAELELPQGVHQGIYLTLSDQQHLGAFYALPFVQAAPKVQIIGNQGDFPLLDQNYYLKQALNSEQTQLTSEFGNLSQTDLLIMTEKASDLSKLTPWVQEGGVLVLFAQPELMSDSRIQSLMPFPLRQKPRELAGPLSWTGTLELSKFKGPLKELEANEKIYVNKQLLPKSAIFEAEKVWAELSDGSPFISGHKVGKGYVTVVHVSAEATWSSLPLSGLLEKVLHQFAKLKHYVNDNSEEQLPPFWLMDTTLNKAPTTSVAENPYGFYGYKQVSAVKNMDAELKKLKAYKGKTQKYAKQQEAKDLSPLFAAAILVLMLLDRILSTNIWRKLPLAIALTLLSLNTSAQELPKATYQTQLAYIPSANKEHNLVTALGLEQLASTLRKRTTIDLAPAKRLTPTDDFGLHPFIYFSVAPQDYSAYIKPLKKFIAKGGVLFIDRSSILGNSEIFAEELIRDLGLKNLQEVNLKHTLNRSFYLTRGTFVGRTSTTNSIWQQQAPDSSPVLIAAHDFVGAWANKNGQYIKPLTHRTPDAREQSLRAGVNFIMYALLGNYKTDQLQTEEIFKNMERK